MYGHVGAIRIADQDLKGLDVSSWFQTAGLRRGQTASGMLQSGMQPRLGETLIFASSLRHRQGAAIAR